MEVKKYQYYAGGVWRDAENGRTFDDLEPLAKETGSTISFATFQQELLAQTL
jgi:hypothetical protein